MALSASDFEYAMVSVFGSIYMKDKVFYAMGTKSGRLNGTDACIFLLPLLIDTRSTAVQRILPGLQYAVGFMASLDGRNINLYMRLYGNEKESFALYEKLRKSVDINENIEEFESSMKSVLPDGYLVIGINAKEI